MTTELNAAAGIISDEPTERVMSPAAKAALDASRARYELAQALLTVLEEAAADGTMDLVEFNGWVDMAKEHLAAEKKRKEEEATYRRANNQRGVGLALHREKTNAALNLMKMLAAAGLSEADIMSGKVTPEEIARVLNKPTEEPVKDLDDEQYPELSEETQTDTFVEPSESPSN